MKLSDHFDLSEFACRCGCALPDIVIPRLRLLAVDLDLGIRMALGRPVNIISGYRCEARNRAVGGARNSRHIFGDAADIQVEGLSGEWLCGFAEAQIFHGIMHEGGLGTYSDKPRTLHYDQRGKKARWKK